MRLTEDVVGADSAVVAELRRRGVRSFAAFLMCDPDWIVANVPGMTKEAEATARARIISAAAAFPERADALLERATAVLLSTGCTTIDAMLGGGLRAGEFTEVFGTSASGKTQLCHQLAVIAAARGGSVVYAIPMTMLRSVSSYIDTTASFSASRIAEIAASRGMPVEEVLARIEHVPAFDAQAVLVELRRLRGSAASQLTSLVVLDSVATAFSSVIARGRAKGHAMLSDAGSLMRSIAAVSGCVGVTTNFAFEGSYVDGGGVKPALGAVWASSPHCRILLARSSSSSSTTGGGWHRTATLTKTNRAVTGASALFCLTEHGIIDDDTA